MAIKESNQQCLETARILIESAGLDESQHFETELDTLMGAWLFANSAEFAVALSITMSWQCAVVRDAKHSLLGRRVFQTLNIDNQSRLVDASGFVTIDELKARYDRDSLEVEVIENHKVTHIIKEDSSLVSPLSVMLCLDYEPYSSNKGKIETLINRIDDQSTDLLESYLRLHSRA